MILGSYGLSVVAFIPFLEQPPCTEKLCSKFIMANLKTDPPLLDGSGVKSGGTKAIVSTVHLSWALYVLQVVQQLATRKPFHIDLCTFLSFLLKCLTKLKQQVVYLPPKGPPKHKKIIDNSVFSTMFALKCLYFSDLLKVMFCGTFQQVCFKLGRKFKMFGMGKSNQYQLYILLPWQFHNIEAVWYILSSIILSASCLTPRPQRKIIPCDNTERSHP